MAPQPSSETSGDILPPELDLGFDRAGHGACAARQKQGGKQEDPCAPLRWIAECGPYSTATPGCRSRSTP